MAMTRELSTTRATASIQLRRLTYAGCRNRLIQADGSGFSGHGSLTRLDEFGTPVFPIVS